MAVYFLGNRTFTKPFLYENEDINVVIVGNFNSDFDITIKVNNLVFFGSMTSARNITFKAKADFIFFSGSINADNYSATADGDAFICGTEKGDEAVQRVKNLGINLFRDSEQKWTINIPKPVMTPNFDAF